MKEHNYFLSSIHKDNPAQLWLSTAVDNEVIDFDEFFNMDCSINSLVIYANTTDLLVQINETDYVMYIPSGEERGFEGLPNIRNFTVLGVTGQEYRFEVLGR